MVCMASTRNLLHRIRDYFLGNDIQNQEEKVNVEPFEIEGYDGFLHDLCDPVQLGALNGHIVMTRSGGHFYLKETINQLFRESKDDIAQSPLSRATFARHEVVDAPQVNQIVESYKKNVLEGVLPDNQRLRVELHKTRALLDDYQKNIISEVSSFEKEHKNVQENNQFLMKQLNKMNQVAASVKAELENEIGMKEEIIKRARHDSNQHRSEAAKLSLDIRHLKSEVEKVNESVSAANKQAGYWRARCEEEQKNTRDLNRQVTRLQFELEVEKLRRRGEIERSLQVSKRNCFFTQSNVYDASEVAATLRNALFRAVNKQANIEEVNKWLRSGANINDTDQEGNSPLHHAVENNDAIMVEFLLEQGADPYLRNKKNHSPLQHGHFSYQTELHRDIATALKKAENAGSPYKQRRCF